MSAGFEEDDTTWKKNPQLISPLYSMTLRIFIRQVTCKRCQL